MSGEDVRCEEVIEQLYAFLDCELDDAWQERVERHLARCRDCCTRAEFERRLRARIREASEVEAPARLRRRVRAMIEDF